MSIAEHSSFRLLHLTSPRFSSRSASLERSRRSTTTCDLRASRGARCRTLGHQFRMVLEPLYRCSPHSSETHSILLRLSEGRADPMSLQQTLLRVWDLFFIHGTVLLFRVALGILKLHEADLLACDSAAGLYGLLGSLPGHVYHADKLLKVSSSVSLSSRPLTKLIILRLQIACEDLAATVKDREIATLRRAHVAALQEELGITASDSE